MEILGKYVQCYFRSALYEKIQRYFCTIFSLLHGGQDNKVLLFSTSLYKKENG